MIHQADIIPVETVMNPFWIPAAQAVKIMVLLSPVNPVNPV
jgi:hypothetical protein